MKKIRLDSLIFRHYARSALLSILTIEILLLAMYFGINSYIGAQTEKTLKQEVKSVMPDLVSQSASAIDSGFALIVKQTAHFAEAHAEVFAHPEAFSIIGEKPVFQRAANGSLYQANLGAGSSLFISATGKSGERGMLVAEKSAALNPLYRHMVEDTPNVVAEFPMPIFPPSSRPGSPRSPPETGSGSTRSRFFFQPPTAGLPSKATVPERDPVRRQASPHV